MYKFNVIYDYRDIRIVAAILLKYINYSYQLNLFLLYDHSLVKD